MRDGRNVIDCGNWVPVRFIVIPATLSAVLAGCSYWWRPLLAGTLLCAVAAVYLLYSRRQFSPDGSDLQARFRDLVFTHLPWDGKGQLLDIGCGNGALAIEAARRYSDAQITGIDCWGGKWEYSMWCCQNNARIASVAGRTTFRKATASSLPFPDGAFDAVVSNMVFHEVQEASDKRAVIREALRVLKKGGAFAFQDLFLWKTIYGEPQALVASIRSWGIDEVNLVDTNQQLSVPGAMRLPFMLGNTGLLYGRK